MTVGEWALVASVVFTGLWSGLFGMLNLVMHPMLAAMSGYDFARFLQAFLPRARHAPFNYVEVIGMVVAPIVALVALGDDPGGTPFVLTASGLALTVAGPLLVSSRLAEPDYDVMLAWDPEKLPTDWSAGDPRDDQNANHRSHRTRLLVEPVVARRATPATVTAGVTPSARRRA